MIPCSRQVDHLQEGETFWPSRSQGELLHGGEKIYILPIPRSQQVNLLPVGVKILICHLKIVQMMHKHLAQKVKTWNQIPVCQPRSCQMSQRQVQQSSFFLNCYYTNANSIMNKDGEFEANIDMWKPKIIGVSESWSEASVLDSEISLPDYTLFREDRKSGTIGGVLLYMYIKIFKQWNVMNWMILTMRVRCGAKWRWITQTHY